MFPSTPFIPIFDVRDVIPSAVPKLEINVFVLPAIYFISHVIHGDCQSNQRSKKSCLF